MVASPSSSTSNATTTTASVKHSLRSATKAAKQGSSSSSTTTELEEHHELLVQEEEKLMQRCVVVRGRGRPRRLPTVTEVEVQEEDDEEITSVEEEPDSEATERTMLTVALVQSVVEASSSSGTTTGPASPATNTTIQSTGSGGGGGPPSPGGSHTYGLRKRRRPSGQDLERLEHFQSTKDGGLARVTVAVKPDDNEGDEPADDNALSAQAKAPPPSPKAKRNFPTSTVSSLLPPPSIPLSISSSVPNPLSQLLESSTLPIPPTADGGGGVGTRVPSVVPCPLLIPPPKDGDGTTAPDHPIDHSGSAPPLSSSKVALSGAVGTDATTSAGTDDAAADKRKVTIHEPDLIVSRKRGFSVDLDCKSVSSLGCLSIGWLDPSFSLAHSRLTICSSLYLGCVLFVALQFSNWETTLRRGPPGLVAVGSGPFRLNALPLASTPTSRCPLWNHTTHSRPIPAVSFCWTTTAARAAIRSSLILLASKTAASTSKTPWRV